ncbi:MAG: LacI family DNA-binding transcriptional regulator [Pseudomonadota bacterium]
MARPTQRQIAAELGLSPATVSLALRGSPMIAEETRALVRDAVARAGYVPNAAAASLRTGRSRIVGVSFHNIAHQFFAEMLIAIEEVLAGNGAAVFINNHGDDPERFARFVDTLAAYGADGLIASPPLHTTTAALDPIRKRGVPVVYASRWITGDSQADRVLNDDRAAMHQATRRLIDLGHRHIVLIGGRPGVNTADDRLAGFMAALSEAGLAWQEALWLQTSPRLLEGAAATAQVLARDPRPTGIVCFNDLVAFGALNAVRKAGLEPGADVAIVGIGGTQEAAAYHPALTTALDNPAKLGWRAAELLIARLDEPNAPPRHEVFAPKLVIRESCGGVRRPMG